MKLMEIVKKHKCSTISKELNIKQSTLSDWLNNKGVKKHIKYIQLLLYLDIDIKEFVENYNNNET